MHRLAASMYCQATSMYRQATTQCTIALRVLVMMVAGELLLGFTLTYDYGIVIKWADCHNGESNA